MKLRYQLLIIWACGHIGLVITGAAGVNLFSQTDETPLLQWYRHVTGTDNSFAFFAPEVGPEERVTFRFTDEQGHQWSDDLELAHNQEANLSFGTIPFVLSSVDDPTAWNMMQSMAQSMLRRHPSAVRVEVRVETYAVVQSVNDALSPSIDFPSMNRYRTGDRPEWLLLYQLTFSRSGEIIESNKLIAGTES